MNDRMIIERIEANLDRLKLPRIREVLDAATQVAMDEKKSYLIFKAVSTRRCSFCATSSSSNSPR